MMQPRIPSNETAIARTRKNRVFAECPKCGCFTEHKRLANLGTFEGKCKNEACNARLLVSVITSLIRN
jgi:hypothetical protein